MSITRDQLLSIGFKPSKISKGIGNRKYDSLVYRLNSTDYIFTGYNRWSNKVDFKRVWKTYYDPESKETISYPLDKMGVLTFTSVKEFVERAVLQSNIKKEIYG